MSAIFQRPLCDMGKAYDYSFRSYVGDPDTGAGGPCDDHPHRVEMFFATADANSSTAEWQIFSLCPGHEDQLRVYDARLRPLGVSTRFRSTDRSAGLPPRAGAKART
ncbi:MAG: hypothetical protein L3J68_03615 [Thermoplasmata archaeon]|nr:hypothetical protein [Thermoplasmata archaeon]